MFVNPPSAPKPKSFVEKYKAKNQQYFGTKPPDKTSTFSVGNRVYNGFSNSPHQGGGLDRSGYAERDAVANTTQRQMKVNSLLEYIKKKRG
jgi:hypothetical protein